jgi:hypothetical protein
VVSTDLAALLVEEGAVPQADVDRALARQAEQGGALDTALLELGLLSEGQLRSFLAHAAGLPAPPAGALDQVDARARRVFPARVADRHRLAPFALDGKELSVVGVHPVDQATVDEIGFMLSLTLVPHVAPEWRVHELIQRLYGGQLSPRLAALSEQQAAAAPPHPPAPATPPAPVPAPDPVAEAVPDPNAALKAAFFADGDSGRYEPASDATLTEGEAPPSNTPLSLTEGEGQGEGAIPETPPYEEPVPGEATPIPETPPYEEPAPPAPAAAESETSFADIEPDRPSPGGFQRSSDEPAEPLLAALELAVDAYDELWADAKPEPAAILEPAPLAPAEAEAGTEGGGAGEAVAGAAPTTEPVAEAPAEAAAPEPAAEPEAPEEEGEEEPEPLPDPARLDRTAPPRWSVDDARAALAAARHRDEVVLAALRFTRDIFEFSALFAVTRDAVVGHDALGAGEEARAHCRATAIYAEDPGIVRTVLETRAPYLGAVTRDAAGTNNILDGLWRGTPRTVLLYPVLLGERAVAVLYADNGEAPVSARRLGELLLFLSTVGAAFERIIRKRKKGKRRQRPAAPRSAAPDVPEAPPASDGPYETVPTPDWMAPPPDSSIPPLALAVGADQGDGATSASAPDAPSSPDPGPAADPPVEDPPAPANPSLIEGEGQGAGMELPHPTLSPGGGEGSFLEKVEAAMTLLREGGDGPPDRVAPIVDLLLSPELELAAAAREAIGAARGAPSMKPVPERLRRGLLTGVGERPVLAAQALGALRDVASIPTLIQSFESGSPELTQAAAEALATVTLQRLGPNPQRWLKWWKENRGRTRDEWLFGALTALDRDLRVLASDDLRAAAEPPLAYDPDAPPADLAATARAWWAWWSTRGA